MYAFDIRFMYTLMDKYMYLVTINSLWFTSKILEASLPPKFNVKSYFNYLLDHSNFLLTFTLVQFQLCEETRMMVMMMIWVTRTIRAEFEECEKGASIWYMNTEISSHKVECQWLYF